MKRTEIKKLYENAPENGANVTVCGWVKSVPVDIGRQLFQAAANSCRERKGGRF